MIRKVGKARWVYTCEPCDVSMICVDQFRALEYAHWHERSGLHGSVLLHSAIGQLMEAVATVVKPALDGITALTELLAPPPNLPHDPSLRKNKRKWGGR